MDKSIAGLLGAVGAFAATIPAQAAVTPQAFETVMQAHSYADLLRPIPNAVAILQAAPVVAEPSGSDGLLQLADDHHHHHRTYRRRRYRRPAHHHHAQMTVTQTIKPV